MNNVILTGHLGSSADMRDVDGLLIAHLSLATTTRYRDREGVLQERTDWHRVTAFKGLAKSCMTLRSGDRIGVQGRLRTSTYEKDGETRTRVEVVANTIEFLKLKERKPDGEADAVEPVSIDEMDGADDIPF